MNYKAPLGMLRDTSVFEYIRFTLHTAEDRERTRRGKARQSAEVLAPRVLIYLGNGGILIHKHEFITSPGKRPRTNPIYLLCH